MSGFKITGFDEITKSLNTLQKKVKALDKSQIPFDKLFNGNFLSRYSTATSFDEFLKQGNFNVNSQEDFEAIPDKEFDDYVAKSTKFKNWDEMLSTATELYLQKYLEF